MTTGKTIQEAIDNASAEAGGEQMDFVGSKCDFERCGGWFAGDTRCECERHAVHWEVSNNGDGTYTAYAAALV